MDKLELAWETYDFHTAMIYDAEEGHKRLLSRFHKFISDNLNPNELRKKRVKNGMNKSFNHLLLIYKKQMDAVSDLIEIYQSDIYIPEEREMNVEYFFELKNVTATLIEELKVHQREINEVLR